ncbi:MAG: D-sedoheptulose-7-phosphate isomerase, partial [Longimicrobiales bacterium]
DPFTGVTRMESMPVSLDDHRAGGPTLAVGPAPRTLPLRVPQVTERYLTYFRALLEQIDMDQVETVVRRIRRARDAGATIYVAGNGGSAATATHLANDLGKATKRSGCRPIRVMCLSDNVSWLTALANDEGYERVFTGQLENFARPGDVLIVISASGNSPNLVNAVNFARSWGLVTIGLLGFDGGALRHRVDESLCVLTEIGAYGPVESAHSVLCDIITTCLIEDRPR